jgi:hypothetical protein
MTEFLYEINAKLSDAVNTAVRVEPMGRNTYRLITPFIFEDGDGFVAYLEKIDGKLRFTDRGHTIMHVSYKVDITSETRESILNSVLATHDLTYNDGEIFTEATLEDAGPAFWDFIQGLIRISDISQWKFERAASLFFEEFEVFMETKIRPSVPVLKEDWRDPSIDESGLYKIPWMCINGGKPLFVFPIQSNIHCDQAVKSCLKYDGVGYEFNSFAVFADIEKINRRSQNQLLDIGAQAVTSFDSQRKLRAEKIIVDHFNYLHS